METSILNIEVPVIDGRGADWDEPVLALLALNKNFLLTVCNHPSEINSLQSIVHYNPVPLTRIEVRFFKDLVTPEDYARLHEASLGQAPVYFIEVLKRPESRPPLLKQYVVYCDFRGLIGDSDDSEEARKICSHFRQLLRSKNLQPFLRIFEWTGLDYLPVRVPCDE